jgi:FKBP-type peptidyl-prolyl cis-trans isomerase SlpA
LIEAVKYPISAGSRVTLHLSLTLEDGRIAESTFGDDPHTFTVGDGSLLPGLERALYGLRPGDTQRLVLHPAQAYGLRDPAKRQQMPRSAFDSDLDLEPGLIIGFAGSAGEEVPGTIMTVTDSAVEVDFNHPLAGHAVTFEVEIIEVSLAAANERE